MRRKPSRLDRNSGRLSDRRMDNLTSSVSELVQKAVQNEAILRRYQRFELQLLDLSGFGPLLDMLLRNTLDHFQLDCVELWLFDPQETLQELLPDELDNYSGLRLIPAAQELQQLYGAKPCVRLASLLGGSDVPIFKGQELRSAAMLPLIRHGVLVGSLHFGARGHQRFTTDKSTDFIAHLASVVAVCLENAVNQERLRRLSMYDMLTKVKNRRAFQQALESEVSRAGRTGDPLSLLFVDLDHFKQINDTYGHPLGDRALRDVAQLIDSMLRKTDHVCRYGGEEFALILPSCGQQRAMEVAERIRLQVSELAIDDEKKGDIKVTLSIGVSCWLPMEDDTEKDMASQLVACSDRGVYQSKAAGRNCTHYVAPQGDQ